MNSSLGIVVSKINWRLRSLSKEMYTFLPLLLFLFVVVVGVAFVCFWFRSSTVFSAPNIISHWEVCLAQTVFSPRGLSVAGAVGRGGPCAGVGSGLQEVLAARFPRVPSLVAWLCP